MKYVEIILKIMFLCAAVVVFFMPGLLIDFVYVFATVSALLGAVLLFNKKQSYGYELSSREVVIRRLEGVLLVIFGAVFMYLKYTNVL